MPRLQVKFNGYFMLLAKFMKIRCTRKCFTVTACHNETALITQTTDDAKADYYKLWDQQNQRPVI